MLVKRTLIGGIGGRKGGLLEITGQSVLLGTFQIRTYGG